MLHKGKCILVGEGGCSGFLKEAVIVLVVGSTLLVERLVTLVKTITTSAMQSAVTFTCQPLLGRVVKNSSVRGVGDVFSYKLLRVI